MLALALAILAGSTPIVKVKVTVVEPDVIVTGLSPERSAAGVHDQLPLASAVAVTDCEPTVPETLPAAVVIPENVGLAAVTQKCLAP